MVACGFIFSNSDALWRGETFALASGRIVYSGRQATQRWMGRYDILVACSVLWWYGNRTRATFYWKNLEISQVIKYAIIMSHNKSWSRSSTKTRTPRPWLLLLLLLLVMMMTMITTTTTTVALMKIPIIRAPGSAERHQGESTPHPQSRSGSGSG